MADEFAAIIFQMLTSGERDSAVVYELISPVTRGETLRFPHIQIEVPWNARLVFIDQQPLANWGHLCRYLLFNPSTQETASFEARFPPFQPETKKLWRVLYRASAIPDSAIAVPNSAS